MSGLVYRIWVLCKCGKVDCRRNKTKQNITKIAPLVRCQIGLFSEHRLFLLRGRGGQSTSSDAYTSSYQGVGHKKQTVCMRAVLHLHFSLYLISPFPSFCLLNFCVSFFLFCFHASARLSVLFNPAAISSSFFSFLSHRGQK